MPAPLALLIAARRRRAGAGRDGRDDRRSSAFPPSSSRWAGCWCSRACIWLVIRQPDRAGRRSGGDQNLYSLLTTYYLPPTPGYALADAVVAGARGVGAARAQARAQAHGLRESRRRADVPQAVRDWRKLVLLVLIVTNQYRGVPLALADPRRASPRCVHLLTHAHAVRPVSLRDRRQRGGGAGLAASPCDATVDRRLCADGRIVALTGFMQTAYSGASTTTVGSLMELDADRRLRHRRHQPARRARHGRSACCSAR